MVLITAVVSYDSLKRKCLLYLQNNKEEFKKVLEGIQAEIDYWRNDPELAPEMEYFTIHWEVLSVELLKINSVDDYGGIVPELGLLSNLIAEILGIDLKLAIKGLQEVDEYIHTRNILSYQTSSGYKLGSDPRNKEAYQEYQKYKTISKKLINDAEFGRLVMSIIPEEFELSEDEDEYED